MLLARRKKQDIFMLKYNREAFDEMITNLIRYYQTKDDSQLSNIVDTSIDEAKKESLIKQFTKDLLVSIDDHRFNLVMQRFEEDLDNPALLAEIRQAREDYLEFEIKLYFFIIIGVAVLAYFFYSFDLYYQQFVPLITQMVVFSFVFFLNRKMVTRLGIMLGFLNILMLYPLKDVFINAKYSYILFIFLLSILLGVCVAYLPRSIMIVTSKSKWKFLYRLALSIFAPCVLFMLLPGVGDYLFRQKHVTLSLLEIFQPLLVTGIMTQGLDMYLKYEPKDKNKVIP